jgi:capsular polysaccharide biosynthesis protein
VIARVLSRLDVSTLGRSRILSIKAQAPDTDTTAAIANAFAQGYPNINVARRSRLWSASTNS